MLNKVLQEECTLFLGALFWESQAWFPLLLDLLVSWHRQIPVIPKILKQPQSLIYHINSFMGIIKECFQEDSFF